MTKVADTRDAQAQAFGFAKNVASAFATVESRACTISGLVVSGTTTFSHVANDAVGQMILVSTNANFETVGGVLFGTVVFHTTGTSAAFTVDGWYTLAGVLQSNTAANSGDFFVLLPCGAPHWWFALSDSTSAVAGTETGVAMGGTELTTNGLGRAQVTTITRTTGSTAATMAKTFSATGTASIGRVMLTNSGVANQGTAYFIDQINSGTPASVGNGDTFTPTENLTLG